MHYGRFVILVTAAFVSSCSGGGGSGGSDTPSARVAPALNFPIDSTQDEDEDVDFVRAFPSLSFDSPLVVKTAPGDATHLYVAQQGGQIRVFDASNPTVATSTVFLDLSERTRALGEQGLLGMAFDPDYATNGYVYVYYCANTNPDINVGDSVIARFTANPDARAVTDKTQTTLLRFAQPFQNHNGGGLEVGPDGMLYVGSGDGGSGDDPHQNAQNKGSLLGKMLRLFPRGTPAQVIPADNPFVGEAGSKGEIWAYGLRNPFRFSFDGARLWAGDVGQNALEEIDLIVKGGNYGWRKFEATRLNFPDDPAIPGAIAPVFAYGRSQGASITGGRVYRGSSFASLVGRYIYGDFVSGNIWSLRESGGVATGNDLLGTVPNPSSFGVGPDGELLITAYDGFIYRLATASGGGASFPQRLSETGLFTDLATLRPAPGVVPYQPNAPFWSDGASKQRWIAVPGTTPTIGFSNAGNWTFPIGTVTVKHFEMPLATPAGAMKRLETRVFINSADDGWQGYTYRWNDAGTDALLLSGAETVDLQATDGHGGTRNQTYAFPSRAQCQQCHTAAAGKVLGVRTSQFNGGPSGNQLAALNAAGYFDRDIGTPAQYGALPEPFGTAPLAQRARAYLETNCSQCHQPGGGTPVDLDLRAATPVGQTRAVGIAGVGPAVGGATTRIVAGNKGTSLAWTRMNTVAPGERMPPVSSHVIDADGLDLIGDWIDAGAN